MTLGQQMHQFLFGYFATNDRASKTRSAYRSDLEQFTHFAGGDTAIVSISVDHVERWAAALQERRYRTTSIRRKLTTLRLFFLYLVRKGLIEKTPFSSFTCRLVPPSILPRGLSDTEAARLLGAAHQRLDAGGDKTCRPPLGIGYRVVRDASILELLFATGMRVGELVAVELSDFEPLTGSLLIHGKGRRERLGYVTDPEALSLLGRFHRFRESIFLPTDALFVNHRGTRLTTQGVASILAFIAGSADIGRRVTPHMIRHTVATLLLRNGADLRVVQEFLGHRSVVTTQRYTHVAKEHLVASLRRHHPLPTLRRQMPSASTSEIG